MAVVRPLAAEGNGSTPDRSAEGEVARVARLARLARTDVDTSAVALQFLHHDRARAFRDEDVERPRPCARDHRRGEGRVAAARDRQTGARVRSRRCDPETSEDLAEDGEPHHVSTLVRARDVARLVLDPEARRRCEPDRIRERALLLEWRDDEALAGDASHRVVERSHESP